MDNVCTGSMEMLTTALEMEEKGRAFYLKAAGSCRNTLGAELFTQLAQDEVHHAAAIRQIYRSLESCGKFTDEWKAHAKEHHDVAAFFTELAAKKGASTTCEAGDVEAVEVGIEMELKAITFYLQRLGKTTDPLERRFLQAIVAEERNHHTALTDMRFYLTNPAAYFSEMERGGLDGA
jgi:rubrerythrin